ncbi:unnamed protein product [Ectocarpus fasciculatus]
MISALLKDAKAALHGDNTAEHLPAGGFTDVGLHTGGSPRDTAWPLACEVFKVGLMRRAGGQVSDSTRDADQKKLEVLFRLVMADLHLSVLESRLRALSGEATDVNEGMEMLGFCSRLGRVLVDDGHAMPGFVKRIEKARERLDGMQAEKAVAVAARYELLPVNELSPSFEAGEPRLPNVCLPSPLRRPATGTGGLAEAHGRSSQNLKGLPQLPGVTTTLTPESVDALLTWAAHERMASGDLPTQLVLREVELLLYKTAAQQEVEVAAKSFGPQHLGKLERLVHTYRSALDTFVGSHVDDCGRMLVELRSRETLVVWIAYVVIFAAARAQWPASMEGFGVSRRPGDVKHLVLSDKLAVEAGLKVADYLRHHTHAGAAIFSLADNGNATFMLAAEVGRESSTLLRHWEDEVAAAKKRRDAHWAKVTAKRACEETESDIAEEKRQLQKTAKVAPVLQPLPEDQTAALRVLFFTHMPSEFRSLSNLSFQAQQILLPRKWNTSLSEAVEQEQCSDSWSAYYNTHQSSEYHTRATPAVTAQDGDVKLGFIGEVGKPETMVEGCGKPSDGVWHPDILSPGRMLWHGGSFPGDRRNFSFNPFSTQVREEWVAQGYTEKLSESDGQHLQWALSQHGIGQTSPERGNVALANQGDAPKWLNKRQYLAFGGVRAYPLTQCRQLMLVLRDRTLPLNHPAVRTLVSQALFHVGDLSSSVPATLLWRHDQADEFSALFDELKIEHTPREYRAMQLLVDMAVYLGDWHDESKSLVRSLLVDISRKWAIDLDHQLQEAAANHPHERNISSMKAKQCMYYMYGVLCFGGSAPLSASDAANLCELHILAHNRRVFTEDCALDEENSSLWIRCLDVVAGRVREIVHRARINPALITSAIRPVLDETPEQLSWMPVAEAIACFEAVHEGHLFSVNLLTGVVLYDGAPPGLLPLNIVEDGYYRRLFGVANFEVSKDSNRVFRTTRAISGRFYEFSIVDGDVVIEEIDECRGERLQLLRHDGAWGKEIPVRLRSMHSQWLCREQKAVVIRSKIFSERGAAFIMQCSDSGGPASCYRVPPHLCARGCRELLKGVEDNELGSRGRLVLLQHESKLMSVLAKFEPRATGPNALIHAYLQPSGGLTIELPRFELEFEVDPPSARQQGEHGGSGIRCRSHRGYQLARAQQLDDTLPGLTRYLILTGPDGETTLLVPRGTLSVTETLPPRVQVECPEEGCEAAEQKVVSYSMHRRWKQPDAGDISTRLQLAAMFAATSTSLPDTRAGMTGAEKASELVRQCFVNHPLPNGDRDQLLRVLEMSGENPALALLCGDLLASSAGLNFLHGVAPSSTVLRQGSTALEHAEIVYEWESVNLPWNRRRRLTVAEEARVFGGRVPMKPQNPSIKNRCVKLPPCPVSAEQVHAAEADVWDMKDCGVEDETLAASRGDSNQDVRLYPLSVPHDADTLTEEMHAELRNSWEANRLVAPGPPPPPPAALERLHEELRAQQGKVTSMQKLVSRFVLCALSTFGTSGHAVVRHIERIAGLLPTAGVADLPPILWENERIRHFNPFLTEAATSELIDAVVVWLRLCVLEDKLGRLVTWSGTSESHALMQQELMVKRTWDPAEHPIWLVFEADSGLQVRPAQAEVALHMIDNPGDIVQLNMGEGKTRVILPLLLLHWATPSDDAEVVRLHFLSALIAEAYEFLHHTLTGSLLGRRLFLMPFNRDVQLTLEGAHVMHGTLDRCRREGGAVLVTPEHRQSLYLKGLELRDVSPELIYAVGDLQKLPGHAERAHAAQALLRVLKHRQRYPKLQALLSDRDVAVEEISRPPEQFDQLRLVPGQALDRVEPWLRYELFNAVLSDPPYEMRWLNAIDSVLRVQVMTLVLDEEASAGQALEKGLLSEEFHWEQLMALRGLLAQGTLLHCLQMRPRVNYGVSRVIGAKKRLAIPFRASNTPADRSEFKEPTLAITLTVLSYYYDGLSKTELRQALETLVDGRVAESAQADYYKAWLAETRPTDGDLTKMDDVHKVDLTNEPQMELLYQHFRCNFEVVNFWLNFTVLPGETKLCPAYIGTNSWFLADNPSGAISGFSGTNDNHRLLPLQVRKNPDGSLPSLAGTNGKMLDLMIRNRRYVTLAGEQRGGGGGEAWRRLLRLAVEEEAHVLVDCGALLGRVSSKEAARFLLSSEGRLPETFRGVVFFDASRGTAAVGGEWMVLDRVGRAVALSGSPIRASEAFAIYDEARCRGADLTLSPDATALLTIGPKNGKDKVMQAAGRLRLLGRSNQSIVFVGTPDVSTKIEEVTRISHPDLISSQHVLAYVMANTVLATKSGLLPWAGQGLHFSETFGRAERAEQEEVMTLDAAYGGAYRRISVHDAVSAAAGKHDARFRGDVHMPQLSKGIASRAEQYGKNVFVSRDEAIGGECEREMELEQEEEEEVERQIAKMVPRKEVDWDYAAVLSARPPSEIVDMAKVRLRQWIGISSAGSSAKTVSCTGNFLFGTARMSSIDDYLRPVDAVLVLANGDVTLLSEREANGVLLARGQRTTARPTAKLVHLSYAGVEEGESRISTNHLPSSTRGGGPRRRAARRWRGFGCSVES